MSTRAEEARAGGQDPVTTEDTPEQPAGGVGCCPEPSIQKEGVGSQGPEGTGARRCHTDSGQLSPPGFRNPSPSGTQKMICSLRRHIM